MQPRIERISSGAQRWNADQGLTLAADSRSFRVDYTELLQMDAARRRFRYRLFGYDDDWVEAGNTPGQCQLRQEVTPAGSEFAVQAWSGGA